MPSKNQNLDRPRNERPYDKSSCISLGVNIEGSSHHRDNERMMFGEKRPEELWGRKRR